MAVGNWMIPAMWCSAHWRHEVRKKFPTPRVLVCRILGVPHSSEGSRLHRVALLRISKTRPLEPFAECLGVRPVDIDFGHARMTRVRHSGAQLVEDPREQDGGLPGVQVTEQDTDVRPGYPKPDGARLFSHARRQCS